MSSVGREWMLYGKKAISIANIELVTGYGTPDVKL